MIQFKKRIKVNFVRTVDFPESFYTVCDGTETQCKQQLKSDLNLFYSVEKLKMLRQRNQALLLRTQRLFIPEFDEHSSEQAKFWKLTILALQNR
jgi:hypothetical protein